MIVMAILLPLYASIIQMSVSRSREFMADEELQGWQKNPNGLQNALRKLENYAQKRSCLKMQVKRTAHMFIINPFSGLKNNFGNLLEHIQQHQIELLDLKS